MFEDYNTVSNEKENYKDLFEVISNTKIIYMQNFVKWSCQQPIFCQTYLGTGQRRILHIGFRVWVWSFQVI